MVKYDLQSQPLEIKYKYLPVDYIAFKLKEEAYKEYLEGQKESETTTNNNIENPKTEDKIYNYLIVLIISILGIGLLLKKYIKIN